MNFTCPKCGCHYEADKPCCPACNFEAKKYTVQAKPTKREKGTSVIVCLIFALEIIIVVSLVAWGVLSIYFGAKGAALLVLLFLLCPLALPIFFL